VIIITATVVMARCAKNKSPFGIRMEKRGKTWFCTWAFAMRESSAVKEGYDKQAVSGDIELDDEYPGCPHCGGGGFVQCGKCNKINCFPSESKLVVCAFCGNRMEKFTSGDFDRIDSGAF
jgi:hypothetical protein